jgi:hypothetical protein
MVNFLFYNKNGVLSIPIQDEQPSEFNLTTIRFADDNNVEADSLVGGMAHVSLFASILTLFYSSYDFLS